MKTIFKSLNPLVLCTTLIIVNLFGTSCNKSKSDNTSNFNGAYVGHLSEGFYTEADTITITSGSSSSGVVMVSKTGVGSTYTINGTVSGSNLNIPSQSVYVANLGTTYTVTGSGTLSGSNLKINYVFVSPTPTTYNWTFIGSK